MLVAACWPTASWAAVGPGRSPLSSYLAARVAASEGRSAEASGDYAIALSGWPDDPAVAVRAYREAMISGDQALALRAARVMEALVTAAGDSATVATAMAAAAKAQNKVVLENAFIAVHVDLSVGIQTVVDKDTGVSYAVRHDLLKYVLLNRPVNKYLLAITRERVRGTCTGYTL